MKFSIALCSGVSLLALSAAALAQQPAAPAAQEATGPETEEVVVTGTRITRDGYEAPTPVTVITAEQLQEFTPSDIPDALNTLPQFAASTTPNGIANNSTAISGNFLNLRGYGVIRTLILLDGRRVPATQYNGTVDVDTLPEMLVQRVDVVTGGASAVYGSDAVTGVVNYVLDDHFTGLKGEMQTGISGYGDDSSYKIGVAAGGSVLDGRGHLIGSLEYNNKEHIEATDRPFTADIPTNVGIGTAASPSYPIINGRVSTSAFGGLVTSGPFKGQQFVGSGVLAPFNAGTPTSSNGVASGGDGAYLYGFPIGQPLQTAQGFGRFEYDFTDDISGYVQASDSAALTDYHGTGYPPLNLTIFSGNPFLPAAAQTQLTATNTPSFIMNRYDEDMTVESRIFQRTDARNITVGVKGTLFDDVYKWDIYYTNGQGKLTSNTDNNINNPRFYAALDAVVNPATGQPVCRVTLTNPGLYPGCQPLNLFGPSNQSAAALGYVQGYTGWQTVNKMDDYAASLTGNVIDDWAGPISVAVDAEYRDQTLVETTSANPFAVPSFTGIRLGTTPTAVWQGATNAGQGPNGNSVWEFGGETVVPLWKDAPFVKNLEFNGAYRFTDYSSSGPVQTWKLGVNYQPIDDLRIRLVDSRDIRAPTLQELYAAPSFNIVSFADLHTGTSGILASESQGNPNLKPEKAHTYTAGFVYSPSYVPRFNMSVDYFHIVISNAIGTISGATQQVQQDCENSNGTSPLCGLIVRPLPFSNRTAANFPTLSLSEGLNQAISNTQGVDAEASYSFDLEDISEDLPGQVNLRVLYTYQPTLISQSFQGATITNGQGYGASPVHKVTANFNYNLDAFTASWQTRFQSQTSKSETTVYALSAGSSWPAYWISDLTLNYRFDVGGHDLQTFLTINNLFNVWPSVTNYGAALEGFGTPILGNEDFVGRYFTIGMRFKY